MRGPRPNVKVTEENKKLISKIHKNKIVSEDTKKKIASKISKPVYIYDINKNLKKKYSGIIEAKKELKISSLTIHKYAESRQIYKEQIFSFTLLKSD
jgi:hypothetical protein